MTARFGARGTRGVRGALAGAALVTALALGGCGGPQQSLEPAPTTEPSPAPTTEPSPDPTATPPTPTEETVAPPTSEEPPGLITEADDGRHVTLSAGEEVPLRLDNAWTWDEPSVEGDVVTLSPVNYFQDPGFVEWSVLAHGSGTGAIEVDGQPACEDEAACPPRTVRIDLTVEG